MLYFILCWALMLVIVSLCFIVVDSVSDEKEVNGPKIEDFPYWVQLVGNAGIALVITTVLFLIVDLL